MGGEDEKVLGGKRGMRREKKNNKKPPFPGAAAARIINRIVVGVMRPRMEKRCSQHYPSWTTDGRNIRWRVASENTMLARRPHKHQTGGENIE